MTGQLGLFNSPPRAAPEVHDDEPALAELEAKKAKLRARFAAKKTAARSKPDRSCPACEAPDARDLVSVGSERGTDGAFDMFFLVTKFRCLVCGHRWELKKRRTDVCDHGVMRKVPCAPCGRTWETIGT